MAYAQYGAGKDKELFGGNYYKTGFTACPYKNIIKTQCPHTEDYNVEPQWATEICTRLTPEVTIGDITSEIKKAQNCNKAKDGLRPEEAHLHFFRTITAGTGDIELLNRPADSWKEKTVSGEHDQEVPRTQEDYDNAQELWKGDFAKFLAAHAKTPLYYPSEIPVTPWGWIDDVYQRTKDVEPLIQPHSLVYDIANMYDVVKDIERRRILFKHIFQPKLAEFTAQFFKTLGASPCFVDDGSYVLKISFAAGDPDLERSCWEKMQETMAWKTHVRLLSQLPAERIATLARDVHTKESLEALNNMADVLIHYFNKIVDTSRISAIPSSLKEKVDFLVENAVKYSNLTPKELKTKGEMVDDILKKFKDHEDILKEFKNDGENMAYTVEAIKGKYLTPKELKTIQDILTKFKDGDVNMADTVEAIRSADLTPEELETIKPSELEVFENHLWVIEEMLPYTDWLVAFFDWALEGVPSSLTKTKQRPEDNEWKENESKRINIEQIKTPVFFWTKDVRSHMTSSLPRGAASGSDGFAANSQFLFTKLFPQKLMDKGWKLDGTLGDIKVNEHLPDFFEFGNDLSRAGSQADQWTWYGIDDHSRNGDLVENHAVSDNIKEIGSFAGKIETFSKVQHKLRWVVEPQLDELIFNLRKILQVPCKEFKVGDQVREDGYDSVGPITELGEKDGRGRDIKFDSIGEVRVFINNKDDAVEMKNLRREREFLDKLCWDTSDILYSVPTYLTRFGIPLDKIGSSDLENGRPHYFCEQVVDVEDGLGKRADQGCGYWEYIYYMENALGPSFVNIRGKLHLLKVAAEKIRAVEDNFAGGSLRRLASTQTRTASTIVNRIHTQMSELFKGWPKMVKHKWDTSAPLSTRLEQLFDNFEAVTYYFEERSGRLISSEIVANYAALQFKTSMPEKTEKTKLDEKDLALAKEMAARTTLKEQKEEQETTERASNAMNALRWWIRQQNKN